jgi:hypothetical protein
LEGKRIFLSNKKEKRNKKVLHEIKKRKLSGNSMEYFEKSNKNNNIENKESDSDSDTADMSMSDIDSLDSDTNTE